ncbi:hypothetical protein KSP40_PGU016636 [Platanthera guangdongensis]|uniref:Uncharacterized protein n=1 Tax=Platanthera guangdongensis TaxID=2320717 RepID=A0ABR2LUC1_9ASPA
MNDRRSGRNGVRRFAGDGLREGFRSDRAIFAGGERKWADDREDKGSRGLDTGFIHHRCGGEGADKDGGSKQMLQQQQQVISPRLLTLPTVLTLGRVVAVPLLVSSRTPSLFCGLCSRSTSIDTLTYSPRSNAHLANPPRFCGPQSNIRFVNRHFPAMSARSCLPSYHMNGSWATTVTTSIFLVAALTDWLDGYLARKMQLATRFGAFLDPVADKLMVAAALVLLCTEPLEVAVVGEVPWVLTVPAIAITGREITMSAVREWAASQSSKVVEAVAVNDLGKWKTATQMTALTILFITRDPRSRLSSLDRRSSPLSFGWTCSVVISGVHEENMEILDKVIPYFRQLFHENTRWILISPMLRDLVLGSYYRQRNSKAEFKELGSIY